MSLKKAKQKLKRKTITKFNIVKIIKGNIFMNSQN